MRRRAAVAVAALAVVVGVWLAVGSGVRLPPREAPIPEPSGTAGSGRTPAEQAAVRRLRAQGLRPASDRDAVASGGRADLESLYVEYHPYFVRGDLDGDGRLDFIQAFVHVDEAGLWFDVAVFFGNETGSFREPMFVERSVSLVAGDVSVDRSLVLVTPDLEAEGVRRWRWEPAVHRFVDADAAAKVPDESEDEPGDRPRAKV